ncbi:MAG: hypothetical protein WC838_03710 [Candidatus Margulisiibacteriota bacterium]|jgi:hypothetical protein
MIKGSVLISLLLWLLLSSAASADNKMFAFAYTAETLPQGWSELEFYLDGSTTDQNDPLAYKYKYQLEYEYGLREGLSLGIYGVLEQQFLTPGGAGHNELQYTQTKFKSVYNPWGIGRNIVDIAFYEELKLAPQKHSVIEGKLLLSKRFGSWIMAANYIIEREMAASGGTKQKYYLGLAYTFDRLTSVGVEYSSETGLERPKQYIIPQAKFKLADKWAMNIAYGNPANTYAAGQPFVRMIVSHLL